MSGLKELAGQWSSSRETGSLRDKPPECAPHGLASFLKLSAALGLILRPNVIPSVQNGMDSPTTNHQEASLTLRPRRWPKKAGYSETAWPDPWSNFNQFFRPVVKVFIPEQHSLAKTALQTQSVLCF